MRTNVDIDDALMIDAMRAGPYSTKREAVEAGLQLLAKRAAYADLLGLRGKLEWSDDPIEVKPQRYMVQSPPPPPYVRTSTSSKAAAARSSRK
jgi:antitoxin ParD1/3/4